MQVLPRCLALLWDDMASLYLQAYLQQVLKGYQSGTLRLIRLQRVQCTEFVTKTGSTDDVQCHASESGHNVKVFMLPALAFKVLAVSLEARSLECSHMPSSARPSKKCAGSIQGNNAYHVIRNPGNICEFERFTLRARRGIHTCRIEVTEPNRSTR